MYNTYAWDFIETLMEAGYDYQSAAREYDCYSDYDDHDGEY